MARDPSPSSAPTQAARPAVPAAQDDESLRRLRLRFRSLESREVDVFEAGAHRFEREVGSDVAEDVDHCAACHEAGGDDGELALEGFQLALGDDAAPDPSFQIAN